MTSSIATVLSHAWDCREISWPISFSVRQRWVAFCEAASSYPSSVRTAMLVLTLSVRRFHRRAYLVTAARAWISATSGVRYRSWVICARRRDPRKSFLNSGAYDDAIASRPLWRLPRNVT